MGREGGGWGEGESEGAASLVKRESPKMWAEGRGKEKRHSPACGNESFYRYH